MSATDAITYADGTCCGYCGAATPTALIDNGWAHILGEPDHRPGCPGTPPEAEATR